MFTYFKQSFAALLIATLLAPGFYFGMAPAPKAEAQMEGIIGSIVGAGVSWALCEYGDELGDMFDSILGGIADLFGLGGLFGGSEGESGADTEFSETEQFSVPVNEQNTSKLQNTASTAGMNETNIHKECVLDPVAWVIKAILVNTITQDILDWVETGFYGGPVFLRDPIAFIKDLSNAALEDFLDESGIDVELCTPFSSDTIDIVREIATQPTYGGPGTTASCNFAGSVGGDTEYIEMVENGDIISGGLQAAAGLILEGNNPYSAVFNLQAETAERVDALVAQQMKKLEYGDGYFSMDCTPSGSGGTLGTCTPGELVSRQVDDWLGGALSELETADEAGEIIEAALSAMIYAIFSDDSTDGLLEGSRFEDDHDVHAEGEGYSSSSEGSGSSGDDETPPPVGGGNGAALSGQFHHTQTDGPDGGQSLVLCPGDGTRFDSCSAGSTNIPFHGYDNGRISYWNMSSFSVQPIVCTLDGSSYSFPITTSNRGLYYGSCP